MTGAHRMAVVALLIYAIGGCGARSGLDEVLERARGAAGGAGRGGDTAQAGAGGAAGRAGASSGGASSGGASGGSGEAGGRAGAGTLGGSGTVADAGVDACAEGGAACGVEDAGSSVCGNGVVEAGEECDDGNQSPGDGCSAACHFEVALVAGGTCALSTGGVVKCWGYNGDGQSGLGDTQNRGASPSDMGDHLPAVDFGVGRTRSASPRATANPYRAAMSVRCSTMVRSSVGVSMYTASSASATHAAAARSPARWATPCPQSISAAGGVRPRWPQGGITPARSSTTAR